jgi:hypothetical protein
MQILFRPDQVEIDVTLHRAHIHIDLGSEIGDIYTLIIDEDTANVLIGHLLKLL